MIRIRQIEVPVEKDNLEEIKKCCSKKIKISSFDIKDISIHKKSIDARKKPNIYYVYEVDVLVDDEKNILKKVHSNDIFVTPNEEYKFPKSGTKKLEHPIVIVGAGPCGLFCSYMLVQAGYKVIIIERGEKIEERVKSVEEFWQTGKLNTNSNVQFGEGGAGTFSDGKLNTLVKDPYFRHRKLLEIFVECGAPKEILYLNKPHIGTNLLRKVIINMRNKIINMGGEFRYNTCLTDIHINNNKIYKIELNNNEILTTDVLVLALGHSARDTFKMLYDKGINMTGKPFAIGIRIQHPQEMINNSQYGKVKLDPASYKLTYKASNGHGVYTFCMCPGGYVVNASSENNKLAINGMSNYERDTFNANSAVIVTISPKDYGDGALDGVEFQRKLEEKAYNLGNGMIPVQLYKDFKNKITSTELGLVQPIFKGNYKLSDISTILPSEIYEALVEGIENFGSKIKGFNRDDAIIAAIESRSSSPIRIIRNELGVSNIDGIYPAGEGAGYAGGITSSGMDGMLVAEWIASIYDKNK